MIATSEINTRKVTAYANTLLAYLRSKMMPMQRRMLVMMVSVAWLTRLPILSLRGITQRKTVRADAWLASYFGPALPR